MTPTNKTIAELQAKSEKLWNEREKVRKAIQALQDICEHDFEEIDCSGHQRDWYFKCSVCGLEQKS